MRPKIMDKLSVDIDFFYWSTKYDLKFLSISIKYAKCTFGNEEKSPNSKLFRLASNLMDLLYLVCHAKIIKEAATSDHESYFIKLEFVPTYKRHLYSIDL